MKYPEELVVDLLAPDRWAGTLRIPLDLVLLIQVAALIADANDFARHEHLLLGHARGVLGDPEDRGAARHRGWEVGVGGDLVRVLEARGLVLGHQVAQSVVVSVDPGLEELDEEVALLLDAGVGTAGHELGELGLAVLLGFFAVVDGGDVGLGVGTAGVAGLNQLLLDLETAGEARQKRAQRSVERDVVEEGEDEEHAHEDGGTRGFGHGEHAHHADLGQVDTEEEVLESSGVEQTTGINVGVGDEQNVVAVGQVEQTQGNGSPEEHDRRNDRIRNA